MARKTKDVMIGPEGGRDQGKLYILKEMSAAEAERWAFRAFQALAKSGAELPDNVEGAGMAELAAVGFRALSGVSSDQIDWLMTEMMRCITFVPDPAQRMVTRSGSALIDDDIEELSTRLRLRMEVFELMTGFSLAAKLSTLTSARTLAA